MAWFESMAKVFTERLITAASKALPLEKRPAPTDPNASVTFVCGSGSELIRLHAHPPLPEITNAFSRLLRTRREWLGVRGADDQVNELMKVLIASLGIDDAGLETIVNAGTVQLSFPSTLPSEVFRFPWEFVIAEATRTLRRRLSYLPGRSFLAYRYLDIKDTTGVPQLSPQPPAPPESSLVVQCAPGALSNSFTFESERKLVESSLNLPRQGKAENPDPQALERAVKDTTPSVIHIAGVDARQARTILGADAKSGVPSSPEDGICLADGSRLQILDYPALASTLTAAGGVQLVSLNLYNSSLGAMEVVRAKAGAAIGFQDEIDDLLAEQFFASFYTHWRRSEWDVLSAFKKAWEVLTPSAEKVRGTGIVLWSRSPLLETSVVSNAPRTFSVTIPAVGSTNTPLTPPAAAAPPAAAPATPRKPERSKSRRTATPPAPLPTSPAPSPVSTLAPVPTLLPSPTGIQIPSGVLDANECINVDFEPPKQLNYSLLHNNANIVPKLVIRRQKPGIYRSIGVQVTVSAGAQEASYRATLTLDDDHQTHDAHKLVRIPLTSELTRTLDESLFSTIYLNVRWGEHILREETHRVAFMPVDEWRYDDANARWLPSFIFPRDPVVREIITAAQRYLVALRDDSTVGFDGYQSFEPSAASIDGKSRNIDAQVQAIWWALVNDYAIGYINPPPNYSDDAQRLRTPSEVINGRRGTCIDLALLMAACLEYVEIYPVVFLLNDHAFPGYWRSEVSYNTLVSLSVTATTTPDTVTTPITERDNHSDTWMIGRGRFAEISALVQQGHIVPLETVSLTSRDGFWPAVKDGISNLRSRRQFHSMFDLVTAREKEKVTPIPIWSKRS